MQEILKVENLEFKYPSYPGLTFPKLLKGINLTVNSGEIKIILGKPESGKSTLLKIILSIIPRYTNGILNGSMVYRNTPLDNFKPYELIEKIGAVFQNPDEQIFTTSCEAEIAFPLESLGMDQQEMRNRVNYALNKIGIEYLRHRNPSTMSGGEKKKLLLACMYAIEPDIWILDETLDELDPGTAKKIFLDLIKEKRTVILFSSKMLNLFSSTPESILILSDGKLIDTKVLDKEKTTGLLIKEGLVLDTTLKNTRHKHPDQKDQLISINNIIFSYPDNKDFNMFIDSFHLYRGEIVSIAGNNGSGKSTLGKIIAGLKAKKSGVLSVNEKEGRSCAYLFQNPDYQIFLPTIEEELIFGLNPGKKTVDETITKFKLPNKNVPPSLMSYGARKRLQAAVYYLMNRNIYILDESDAGLSLEDFDTLISLLYKSDRGIIIISHNIELCSKYSDRIYIMNEGKIVKKIKKNYSENLTSYFLNGES